MSPWDRRQFLWTIAGLSAAPFFGCRVERQARSPRAELLGLPSTLREIADRLGRHHSGTSILARFDRVQTSLRDAETNEIRRGQRAQVRLRGATKGRVVELVTPHVTPNDLATAADELAERLGQPESSARSLQRAAPRTLSQQERAGLTRADELRARASDLFAGLSSLQSSRLIRRAARITTLERTTILIDDTRQLAQHTTHDRAEAEVVAWTGSSPSLASMSAVGTASSPAFIDSKSLLHLSELALTMLTARRAPAAETNVLLSPRVTALLVGACLAPCLDETLVLSGLSALAAPGMRKLGSPLIQLEDRPTTDGFGTFFFDDEGQLASGCRLIENGMVVATLGGQGRARARRRTGRLGDSWQGVASNLVLAAGKGSMSELIAEMKDGIVVDGPVSARIDPRTLTFSLSASRGLAVERGALSGRSFGRLEVRGRLNELLASTRALTSDTAILGWGDALPVQVEAPGLLARSYVGPA